MRKKSGKTTGDGQRRLRLVLFNAFREATNLQRSFSRSSRGWQYNKNIMMSTIVLSRFVAFYRITSQMCEGHGLGCVHIDTSTSLSFDFRVYWNSHTGSIPTRTRVCERTLRRWWTAGCRREMWNKEAPR